MAFLELKNVRIAGVAAGVPKNIISNLTLSSEIGEISSEYTPEAFVELTGVKERRVSDRLTTSDLGFAAAQRLISDLEWEKSEIEAIIFVSQTADYFLPCTACILQDKLGLSKECYAADVTLGCSGWVYGLSYVAGLVSSGAIKKALLIVGDAKKRIDGPRDPLFGHAGTATAIEYVEGADGFKFHFGTDGSGYDAIITPDGGARNRVSVESFKYEDYEGKPMNGLMTRMKGMDVFSFGITTAPKSVKKLAEYFNFDYLSYDWFLFHQANMKMNNMIVKKLKLPSSKVPSEMYHFGNTSSASIPLLFVTQIREKINGKRQKFLCCGFGVGLSWGTVVFEDAIHVSKLVEVDDSAENYGYKL
jgi:3-oxoacyl-[acyl-carrier-protein] synthase-3